MKKTMLLLSVLVLFSFCTNQPSFCSATRALDAVLDVAGKKLQAGSQYYLIPIAPTSTGGLTLENSVNKTCPYDVFQDQNNHGNPVAFYPLDTKKDVIRVSTDLNIDFLYTITICPQSTIWTLAPYHPSTGEYFVTTGGVKGNPGPETIKNWFKIERLGDGYKFVYCPTVCNYCEVVCKDLGIFVDNGRRRLALSDVPYNFLFKST